MSKEKKYLEGYNYDGYTLITKIEVDKSGKLISKEETTKAHYVKPKQT